MASNFTTEVRISAYPLETTTFSDGVQTFKGINSNIDESFHFDTIISHGSTSTNVRKVTYSFERDMPMTLADIIEMASMPSSIAKFVLVKLLVTNSNVTKSLNVVDSNSIIIAPIGQFLSPDDTLMLFSRNAIFDLSAYMLVGNSEDTFEIVIGY